MKKLKYKVIHTSGMFLRNSYIEVVNPTIELRSGVIVVKDIDSTIVAIYPDSDILILQSSETIE